MDKWRGRYGLRKRGANPWSCRDFQAVIECTFECICRGIKTLSVSVAPYAVRAKDNAPVATPLFWEEVSDPTLHPQKYTISNIMKRKKDPWEQYQPQTITHAYKLLKGLK